MALVVWETALALEAGAVAALAGKFVLGTCVADVAVCFEACARAGPREMARMAVDLRSRVAVFTV
jgi:hypothetical protein